MRVFKRALALLFVVVIIASIPTSALAASCAKYNTPNCVSHTTITVTEYTWAPAIPENCLWQVSRTATYERCLNSSGVKLIDNFKSATAWKKTGFTLCTV